jgi:hypothetical protein
VLVQSPNLYAIIVQRLTYVATLKQSYKLSAGLKKCAGAKAIIRLATDQSYRQELMLYLGKSLGMRDGLFLLLGAMDPKIAPAYTGSDDKLFVLDKAMHLHDTLTPSLVWNGFP